MSDLERMLAISRAESHEREAARWQDVAHRQARELARLRRTLVKARWRLRQRGEERDDLAVSLEESQDNLRDVCARMRAAMSALQGDMP